MTIEHDRRHQDEAFRDFMRESARDRHELRAIMVAQHKQNTEQLLAIVNNMEKFERTYEPSLIELKKTLETGKKLRFLLISTVVVLLTTAISSFIGLAIFLRIKDLFK